MAKDAPSSPDPASSLPLDVFHVPPELESRPTASAPKGAEPAATDGPPVPAVASAAPPPVEVSHPAHAAPLPPVESSIASVVIDAPLLDLPSASADPTVPPDVPTVRLRPARRSGKRLGREVLLAVFGMGFCLLLYGVGSELLANRAAPSSATTSIGAARPQGESANGLEGADTANAAATEAVPPLEPAAEHAVPEPAEAEPESVAAETTPEPKPSAEAATSNEHRPASPLQRPPKTKPAGVSPPDPARGTPATKPSNVFDTPLRPPAE